MLKNKIIAFLSVAAMMFSFATVVNAEKTPIITDPTFFVESMGWYEDENAYEYCLGVNYTYDGEDPIDYAVTGTGSRAKYSGAGFKVVSMDFNYDKIPADKIVAVYSAANATLTNADSIKVNGHIDATSTSVALNQADLDYAQGPVFFYIYTSEEVDTSLFECTNLTINIVDYGNTAQSAPATLDSWTYSSDKTMIEAGAADFLAYTAPAASDDDDEEEEEITINDKYVFKFTAEEDQDVMVTLKRANGITSDLTYALPENVKGTASIFGLLKVVNETVVSGDSFDIAVVDADRKVVKEITTINVD